MGNPKALYEAVKSGKVKLDQINEQGKAALKWYMDSQTGANKTPVSMIPGQQVTNEQAREITLNASSPTSRKGYTASEQMEMIRKEYGGDKPISTGQAFMGGLARGITLGTVGYKPEEFKEAAPEHTTAFTVGDITGQFMPFGAAYKGANLLTKGIKPGIGRIAATGAIAGAPVGAAQSAIAGDDTKTVAKNALLYGALGAAGDVAIEGIAAPIVKRLWQAYKGKAPVVTDAFEREVAKEIGVNWDNMNETQKTAIRRVVQKMQPEATEQPLIFKTQIEKPLERINLRKPPKETRLLPPGNVNFTLPDQPLQSRITTSEIKEGPGFTFKDTPIMGVDEPSLKPPLDSEIPKGTSIDSDLADIYNNITADLDGVGTTPDVNIAKIAKEVSGNAMPIRYNMTDIYRTLRNSFGKHADYVKRTYLDPFDYSKGEYAKGIKKETNDLYNDVVQRLGIQKGSKESAAVQWYGEGKRLVEMTDPQTGQKGWGESPYTEADLKREFPQKWEQIKQADAWFRKRYDDYVDSVNATLKKIYPYVETEVEKLRTLQTELRNQKNKVLKDSGLSDEAKKSASDVLTEQIRTANQKINDMLLNRRLPKRNDYYRHFREMGKGFQALENLLGTSAQIDPRLVGVSDTTLPKSRWASFMQRRGQGYYEADAVGGFLDYIKPANYKVHIEQHIPKFRQLAKDLAESTTDTKNANNLIEHLQLFANDLAGKTNEFDRPLQKTVMGRKAMGIINWVNSRVMANAVLGNARSVISQTANLPLGMSRLKDPVAMKKATGQMLSSLVNPSSPIKQVFKESPFLSERYLDSVFSKFDNKVLDQPEKFAAWAMRSSDELATKWMWATAYNKAIKQGVPNPIKWADDFTRSIVAGRGIGEMPLAQKSMMGRLFMPFQVEVGNMWHVFGDALKEKDYAGLAIMPFALWLFNEGYQQLVGSDVTFNPLGALQDALDEEDITPGKVAGRLAGEVISNLPGGQTLATIVPENMRQQYFGRNDPTRFGTGGATFIKPLTNAVSDITKGDFVGAGLDLANYVLPFGGAQLKKTVEGSQAIAKGGSYMNNGQLRFPIAQTPTNAVKSVLFGQYSTPEAREYFDQNRRPLGEKQTKAYQQSGNKEALYRQILRDRELQNINDKISQLNKDTKMTPEEKRREYEKLNERRKKLRGA